MSFFFFGSKRSLIRVKLLSLPLLFFFFFFFVHTKRRHDGSKSSIVQITSKLDGRIMNMQIKPQIFHSTLLHPISSLSKIENANTKTKSRVSRVSNQYFETDSLNNRKRKETARITIDEGSLRVDRWTGKRTLATERAISPGFIDFRICRRRR